MRFLRRLLLLLLIVFIVIQFFRPKKNIAEGPQPNNIATVYPVPENVKGILARACNDCHSNNTRYPWYNNIQPVAWWLADHVKDGKKELNFDEFASYRPRRQYNKLEQSKDLVEKDEMPLDSYTWIHRDARLSEEDKKSLYDWVNSIRAALEAKYPMDSLVRKSGGTTPAK
jgi:hypothetical protein